MTSTEKKRQDKKLELDPNAWEKFEALIKNAAKMGHKPHSAEPKRKREADIRRTERPGDAKEQGRRPKRGV